MLEQLEELTADANPCVDWAQSTDNQGPWLKDNHGQSVVHSTHKQRAGGWCPKNGEKDLEDNDYEVNREKLRRIL